MKPNFPQFKKAMRQLSGMPTPDDIKATPIQPHPLMTNAEADFLLTCMPDDAIRFIRETPQERMTNEPPNAYLVRRKFQQRIKHMIPES